jgi:hypothetical protein
MDSAPLRAQQLEKIAGKLTQPIGSRRDQPPHIAHVSLALVQGFSRHRRTPD